MKKDQIMKQPNSMFTSLYDIKKQLTDNIRPSFQAKITPDMTKKAKAALNTEYRQAVADAVKKVDFEQKKIAAANVAAFLADPERGVKVLQEECGRTLDLGGLLLSYGIATCTIKRHGKGEMMYKGALAEGTISNFTVSARIEDKVLVEEMGSRNDRQSKDSTRSFVVGKLAINLAIGN